MIIWQSVVGKRKFLCKIDPAGAFEISRNLSQSFIGCMNSDHHHTCAKKIIWVVNSDLTEKLQLRCLTCKKINVKHETMNASNSYRHICAPKFKNTEIGSE